VSACRFDKVKFHTLSKGELHAIFATQEWLLDNMNGADNMLPDEVPKSCSCSGWMRNEREARDVERSTI